MNHRYNTDENPREHIHKIEKNYIIEKPDVPRFISEVLGKFKDEASVVKEEVKDKIEEMPILSKKPRKKTKVIHEEDTSKNTKKKSKKNNSKSNKATVASI